jgi:hypothetical protein
MQDIYIARIRAYSVDPSSEDCSFEDPPTSYWPGDYTDVFSYDINAGEHSHFPGYYTLEIEVIANPPYFFGTTGNTIAVVFNFQYSRPASIAFTVNINGSSWFERDIRISSFSESFTLNIDGLPIGHHSLTISTAISTSPSVLIDVVDPTISNTNLTGDYKFLITALTIGISIGSIVVIATVVILSIRLKRRQVVEYDSSEADDSVLELD